MHKYYSRIFIVNNRSNKLCGVQIFSKQLINAAYRNNSKTSLLFLNLPQNLFHLKNFCKCFEKLNKSARNINKKGTLFVFNVPTSGRYNRFLYFLVIIINSFFYDTGVIYHGYFHVNLKQASSSILLFLGNIKYRYHVTSAFLSKMHKVYKFLYSFKNSHYLPVIPEYPKSLENYLCSSKKEFNNIIPKSIKKDLINNYAYYFGIINPQKNIIEAIKLSQKIKTPILMTKPVDKKLYKSLINFIKNNNIIYKPIIIDAPSLKEAYKLIECSKFVLNIPYSGVGEWSSSWLTARLVGKIVFASHPTKFGYEKKNNTFFVNNLNDFYKDKKKISLFEETISKYSGIRKPSIDLENLNLKLRKSFLKSFK